MTEAPRSRRCDDYQQDLAELALGVLTGRQRAATLAHVDSCDHCAEELEQLSRTADAVVYVAPEEEPPVGFEVRLRGRGRPRRRVEHRVGHRVLGEPSDPGGRRRALLA